jgi:hypothetical protein
MIAYTAMVMGIVPLLARGFDGEDLFSHWLLVAGYWIFLDRN